jgi:hypothetical protein
MSRASAIVAFLLEDDADFGDINDFMRDHGSFEPTSGAKFKLGSMSTGTLDSKDIIDNCLPYLEAVSPSDANKMRAELDGAVEEDRVEEFFHERFWGVMQFHTPPFTYYGSNEGSSSDVGVWPIHEILAEIERGDYDNPAYVQFIQLKPGQDRPDVDGRTEYVLTKRGEPNEWESYAVWDGRTGALVWDERNA